MYRRVGVRRPRVISSLRAAPERRRIRRKEGRHVRSVAPGTTSYRSVRVSDMHAASRNLATIGNRSSSTPRRSLRRTLKADPEAFRTKFRKMAADPFAFFRGSACLFYADVAGREDRWADERTSRVWIQGDLHAENFGTYMDASGVLSSTSTTSTRRTSDTSPGTWSDSPRASH